MKTKVVVILIVATTIGVAAAWSGLSAGRTKEIPLDCQFIAGSKRLSLDDLKNLLQLLESPQLSLTPGIEVQAKKLRACIKRIEGSSSQAR